MKIYLITSLKVKDVQEKQSNLYRRNNNIIIYNIGTLYTNIDT